MSGGVLPSDNIIETYITDVIGFKMAIYGCFVTTIDDLSRAIQVPVDIICKHIESILIRYNQEGWHTSYNPKVEFPNYSIIEIYKPENSAVSA
jgi:hypothetical protein